MSKKTSEISEISEVQTAIVLSFSFDRDRLSKLHPLLFKTYVAFLLRTEKNLSFKLNTGLSKRK